MPPAELLGGHLAAKLNEGERSKLRERMETTP